MDQDNRKPVQTNRLSEVDLVRAIAIIGVLAVHATSFATLELREASSLPFYNFINIFMKFGTPVFIFLSSFVLFLNYYNRPFSKATVYSFYRKRLSYIIIPYLVFSIIYFIAVAATRSSAEASILLENPLRHFLLAIATGTAYPHLYFVFISIQFYLLFPLALRLLQRYPRLIPWLIPFGFAVQWLFLASDTLFGIPNEGSWALSYFSFYWLGAYCGIHYYSFAKKIRSGQGRSTLATMGVAALALLWLTVGLWHAEAWLKLRMNEPLYPAYGYSLLWNMYAVFSALLFLWFASFLVKRLRGSSLLNKLRGLGSLSFGIYLVHPLLLAVYRELRPEGLSPSTIHLWYAGGFVLALFGSWCIVYASFRYVPFAGIGFGKNELHRKTDSHKSRDTSSAARSSS